MGTSTITATVRSTLDPDRAHATLTTAFSSDPVARWLLPEPARYLAHFPEALQLIADSAFDTDTADQVDNYGGAALWVCPGAAEPDEGPTVERLQRSIDPDRHTAVFEFVERMNEHHPSEPCWYLPFIGVDPPSQGRGNGSRLLVHGLTRCDRDHLPAYLEATSARSRVLYERHGFVVIGEIQAGDSPPVWPMLRAAR